jgi:hypothetical protein
LRYHSPKYIQSRWATAEAFGLSVAGGVAPIAALRCAGGGIRWLPNVRGIEVTISRNLRIGWHRFTVNGRTVYRPHWHRRIIDRATGQTKPGGGIGRHRPWQ